MFVCVSLNPAIDKRLRLEKLQRGRVNRATDVRPEPGGKAAHVAMVLRTLGADPLWLGFAGGSTGTELIERLNALSIRTEPVATAYATRTNLEVLEGDGTVTEVLEPGHLVSKQELQRFQEIYELSLRSAGSRTIAILSGSLPPGVPEDYYATLIRLGHESGCCMFLDTSGEPLRRALNAQPDFVKPNQHEAEWLNDCIIDGPRAAGSALKAMLSAGAKAGAVSLGADGLIWAGKTERRLFFAKVPPIRVRSSVGSGDAALAGFAYAESLRFEPGKSLRLAAACGVANCLAESPERFGLEDVARMEKEIHVDILD